MKKAMAFILALAMLAGLPALAAGTPALLSGRETKSESRFSDVASTAWYRESVDYVYEKGLMQGTEADVFSPDDTVTRGMVTVVLHRLEGTPEAAFAGTFADVPNTEYYAEAVEWAFRSGVLQGYGDGRFGPNDAMTREQLITALYNYTAQRGCDVSGRADLSSFADAGSQSSYATEAIAWAVAEGIISGKTGNRIAPKDSATRSELAAILQNFCERILDTATLTLDNTKWQYNAEADVYWQVGVRYCETPADTKYETLGIYVPGAYMNAADNGDGTYTCTVEPSGTVSGYTALTAPFVIPVDTPGYSAMSAPTGYTSAASTYTAAGFIYVRAGCRGRDAGAPAGVTDLKAAIRFVRSVADRLPGDPDRFFSFGMSGGGAQSALLGSTGDSELYDPYLEAIGAVMSESDAVLGSMCWCPITNLDYANEAYEWNMGVTRSDLDDETQALSNAMAEAFAQYINELGLTDEEGAVLMLTQSEEGIYQAGSYYDYIKGVVETSLNNFLSDTTFPYTASSGGGRGGNMGGGFPGGGMPDMGGFDRADIKGGMGDLPDGETPHGGLPGGYVNADGDVVNDGIDRTDVGSTSLSGTYETAQDYIDALNADGEWVIYDAETNTATITSVAAFAQSQKKASKSVGAFDALNSSQGENILFGYGDGKGAHFDSVMADILTDLGSAYAGAYAADLQRTDALGSTVDARLAMYTPLYYLSDHYEGAGEADVAQYWRIRTGIMQGDTALCTEVNLALALENYGCDVDFATVWGQGHTEAERTGSSSENFIAWINQCLAGEGKAADGAV